MLKMKDEPTMCMKTHGGKDAGFRACHYVDENKCSYTLLATMFMKRNRVMENGKRKGEPVERQ
jgi:hypothetical protein